MGCPLLIPSQGQLALSQSQLRHSSGAGPLLKGVLDVPTQIWGRRLLAYVATSHATALDHGAKAVLELFLIHSGAILGFILPGHERTRAYEVLSSTSDIRTQQKAVSYHKKLKIQFRTLS